MKHWPIAFLAPLLLALPVLAQGSALTPNPSCQVTLTAYDTPIPYSDRQLVPMVVTKTRGRECPTPTIQDGQLLHLDTPGNWLAGIGMRIQARVQRFSSMGTEGPVTGLHWSHFADAQGTPFGGDHPLRKGTVSLYQPQD